MTAPVQPLAGTDFLNRSSSEPTDPAEKLQGDSNETSVVQEVGILFVHGMGKHQRGDILRQIGEPLYLWMAAWLGNGSVDASPHIMRARESSLRVPHAGGSSAPANSVVDTVVVGADGRRRRITWVAGDGWWADEVVQPSFSQVASWGLGLAPWMIVRYFRQHLHGLLVVPSLVIVVLFQMITLTLSIFGAVPQLRSRVAGLQLRITGSIGDVMVMVANPLQLNAMTTRLVDQLRWLHEQVPNGRIAVIAHSQGTGLAHAALQVSHVPVDLLVTFGTALEKLHIARQMQENPRRLAVGSSLTIVGGVMLALAALIAINMEAIHLTASASLVGQWLLGTGAVLLMARTGLWFHLRRPGGVLLTLLSIAIVLLGLVLTPAVWTGADEPWQDSLRTLTVSRFWEDWTFNTSSLWALVSIVIGLVLAVVREYVAFVTPERRAVSGTGAQPGVRAVKRSGPLGLLLDGSSVLGNVFGATALIFGLVLLGMATPPEQSAEGNAIMILVVAGLAFCFAAVPLPIASVTEPTARDLRLPRREGRLQWHNYWAAADPVPDGNLPIDDTPYVTNHEVRNRDSILKDHVTYTENREEFLADLALHLSAIAGWDAFQPDDLSAIARAQQRRRWRVRFLSLASWLTSLGTVLTWWILGAAGLTIIGRPVVRVAGYLAGILPGVDGQSFARNLPQALLGMVTVAVIASCWFRWVVSPAWQYWDSAEGDVLFRREQMDKAQTGERRVAVFFFALSAAIGLCAAVWSPTLLQQLVVNLKQVVAPLQNDNKTALITHWPWHRESLLHTGLWSLPLPYIAVATLVVAVIFSAAIRASIRANSQKVGNTETRAAIH